MVRSGACSSLSDYFNLAPTERALWKQHIREHPHGDLLTHRLLATLCSMVASIGGGKNVKPSAFASWIDWGEEEAEEWKPTVGRDTLEAAALGAILDRQIAEREQD